MIAWGDTEVGVDVQQHNMTDKEESFARRWFAPDELSCALANPQRFYEIWTNKESYLKYLGTGMNKDLRSFSVLDTQPGIRFMYRKLSGGYSLSLCSTDDEYTVDMLNVEQLL